MQDTIIKGTGNSRSLASVPNFLTLYPTYEAFGQALINRELPIDLGPINPTGVDVIGTLLSAGNIFGKETGSYIGGSSSNLTLTFNILPKYIFIFDTSVGQNRFDFAFLNIIDGTAKWTNKNGIELTSSDQKINNIDGTTVMISWSTGGSAPNLSGVKYIYIALN